MTVVNITESTCSVCGHFSSTQVLVGVDFDYGIEGEFRVVRCDRCGHHRLNPRPSDEDLGRLYPDDYRPFVNEGGTDTAPTAPWKRAVGDFLHFGPPMSIEIGRLLELGCGTGDTLARFCDSGWSGTGIEPSTFASKFARDRGLDVRTGTDQLVDEFPAGEFDLVHAFMVIEHTPDPVATLRRLRRVAKSGSVLRVSVPNFDHASRHRFGRYWYALQVPHHLQHFGPTSIREALDASGWRVERIWYQPTNFDTWGSIDIRAKHGSQESHSWSRLRKWSRLIDVATLPFRIPLVQVRGGSRMTVTARAV